MSEQQKNEIKKIEDKNSEISKTEQATKEIAEQDEFTSHLLNQQIGVYQRWFPNDAEKRIIEFQSNLIKQKADSKLENHRMFYEFQRQTIKETFDAVLIQGKGTVRKNTSNVFALQLSELEGNLLRLSDEHDKTMDAAFDKLETIKAKPVRDKKEQFLLNLTDKFLVDFEKLLDRYRSILDETV